MGACIVHARCQPVGVDAEFANDGRQHIENARAATSIQSRGKRVVADSEARGQPFDGTRQRAGNQTLQPARDRDSLLLLHASIPPCPTAASDLR